MRIDWERINIKEADLFECQFCGSIILVDKSKYDEKHIKPIFCDEDQGGCGRRSLFLKLKHDDSRIENIIKKHLKP